MLVLALILGVSLTPQEFVLIPSGRYRVGRSDHIANPLRYVNIRAFQIATTETTNALFAEFVNATGYITDAEKLHNAMVFEPGLQEFRWIRDSTANWRFPNGRSRGGIEKMMAHPVTSISYRDALAYCKWAKVRLPTLNEWEVASRAGSDRDYFFGESNAEIGFYANVWHGRDHLSADLSDGFMRTSPVATFAPNPNGLYDIYGNVFEFCTGRLKTDRSKRVVHARGGSWWCSKYSCSFFNSVDIGKVDHAASFSNQGFRVAKNASN